MKLARLIARVAYEIAAEYQQLSKPPPAAVPGRDPASLPGCDTQVAYQQDPNEVAARQGFGFTAGHATRSR